MGQEFGEGREVGHAERAPVAAEVCLCVGVSGVLFRQFGGGDREGKEGGIGVKYGESEKRVIDVQTTSTKL